MPVTFRGKSVSNKEVILSFIQLLLSVKLVCAFISGGHHRRLLMTIKGFPVSLIAVTATALI